LLKTNSKTYSVAKEATEEMLLLTRLHL